MINVYQDETNTKSTLTSHHCSSAQLTLTLLIVVYSPWAGLHQHLDAHLLPIQDTPEPTYLYSVIYGLSIGAAPESNI